MTNQELQTLKNKYDIIGNDPALNRALEIAVSVAPTDITVLVTGESGVGKENIPKIIHQNSRRRNSKYFAINRKKMEYAHKLVFIYMSTSCFLNAFDFSFNPFLICRLQI